MHDLANAMGAIATGMAAAPTGFSNGEDWRKCVASFSVGVNYKELIFTYSHLKLRPQNSMFRLHFMPFSRQDNANILYENDDHICIAFTHLVEGNGIQANQFLIIDQQRAALIDPGGDLTYTPLVIELGKRISTDNLDYIFASHQDPDIIASLPRWVMPAESTCSLQAKM